MASTRPRQRPHCTTPNRAFAFKKTSHMHCARNSPMIMHLATAAAMTCDTKGVRAMRRQSSRCQCEPRCSQARRSTQTGCAPSGLAEAKLCEKPRAYQELPTQDSVLFEGSYQPRYMGSVSTLNSPRPRRSRKGGLNDRGEEVKSEATVSRPSSDDVD